MGADDEVSELSAALAWFAQRLNEFMERERHFTRDASHELRSPLTVIQMASDVLLQGTEPRGAGATRGRENSPLGARHGGTDGRLPVAGA